MTCKCDREVNSDNAILNKSYSIYVAYGNIIRAKIISSQ